MLSIVYGHILAFPVCITHTSKCWLLYRNKQFAVVENPGFWHWTFSLKDKDGGTLAEIDRNWRGFGYEVWSICIPCFCSRLLHLIIGPRENKALLRF